MERLYGVVTKITYYDEDRGFGIIRIKLDFKDKEIAKFRNKIFSNSLTVLSNFDRCPIIDEEYEFQGDFETSSYGLQFRAKSFSRRNEQTKEGVITYLSSQYFPGIGKAIASKVFMSLGKNCLDKIVKDKSVLDKVDITNKQKQTIYENLIVNQANEKQLVDLLNLGITLKMSIRIIKILGIDAFKIVKNNPYQLINLVEGIGFLRADTIALNNGITKDSPLRLKALIRYCLEQYIFNSGNTFIHVNDLYIEACKFVNNDEDILTKDMFQNLATELIDSHEIIMDEDFHVFDYKIYKEEYEVARFIYQFLKNEKLEYHQANVTAMVDKVMYANDIEYSEKQLEAINKALLEPIVIITGGPGTGKSTIIKGIIDSYASLFPKGDLVREGIMLVAPTGRASKRLREVTKHPAMTIHKLLGYEGGNRFTITPEAPLNCKMVIIDEFSMVDISLAKYLFSVLLPETKIIIVGDADQLPSVGPGNVLQDLIESKEITTIKLDKIHRQASDSSIISLAHHINNGQMPDDIFSLQHDRNFICCDDLHIIRNIEKTIASAIEKKMDITKDIQVLVPMYKGDVGINAINFYLQDKFNPCDEELNYQEKRFRVNDKVIQLVNRTEKNVMNGDIGSVFSFAKEEGKILGLSVMFDSGKVDYEKDELDDLNLAYAISIHKSQGSEFPLVIIPFSFKYYIMLKRKLIYTAVTRAKKYLIMLGNYEAMRKGIVELEEQRKTKLSLRIKEFFKNPNIIKDPKVAFSEIEEDDNMENISPYDFM